jgi:hypothetical protein
LKMTVKDITNPLPMDHIWLAQTNEKRNHFPVNHSSIEW